MTHQEYLTLHPSITLEPAPITGGADIQSYDYFCSLCFMLYQYSVKDSVITSYKNSLFLLTSSPTELSCRLLFGNGHSLIKPLLKEFLELDELSDIIDTHYDFSVMHFATSSGNIFVIDYYESMSDLHNDAYIRCVMINNPSSIPEDLKHIQQYLEQGNNDADNDSSIITTEQDGNDIHFHFWYKHTNNT